MVGQGKLQEGWVFTNEKAIRTPDNTRMRAHHRLTLLNLIATNGYGALSMRLVSTEMC